MSLKPFKYIGANKELKPHLKKVIDGEYDFGHINFRSGPIVLDLGANIGSYTYWILNKYPDAYVIGFEPVPSTAAYYVKNLTQVADWSFCLMQAAVYPTEDKTIKFYLSEINAGMHSTLPLLTNTLRPQEIQVPVCHPRLLPQCDILKMDIEGAEVPVLKEYLKTHFKPAVVSFEFHCFGDRFELEQILGDEYILTSAWVADPNIGTMTFVHRDYIGIKEFV